MPWLFFSAGMLFWPVRLTLVFSRLNFHDPLPGRLYPTLAILIVSLRWDCWRGCN